MGAKIVIGFHVPPLPWRVRILQDAQPVALHSSPGRLRVVSLEEGGNGAKWDGTGNYVSGERVADESASAILPGRGRIINLALADGPAERVGAELWPQPLAEVSCPHSRGWEGPDRSRLR